MTDWHLVEACWFCDCDDIERCVMERYVADVRIAHVDVQRLRKALSDVLTISREVLQAA